MQCDSHHKPPLMHCITCAQTVATAAVQRHVQGMTWRLGLLHVSSASHPSQLWACIIVAHLGAGATPDILGALVHRIRLACEGGLIYDQPKRLDQQPIRYDLREQT